MLSLLFTTVEEFFRVREFHEPIKGIRNRDNDVGQREV